MRHERWDRHTEEPQCWTEWKRKRTGLVGCIMWTGAPYTCKWYTLSGRPGTSSHSWCCWMDFPEEGGVKGSKRCVCVCVRGKEVGWGCLGALYKRRLLGKRKPCSGQGLVKSRLRLGCTSMHKPTLSSFDPPPMHLAPFQPVCSVLVKKGVSGKGEWEVGYHIFVWRTEEQKSGGSYRTPESVPSTLAAADTNCLNSLRALSIVFLRTVPPSTQVTGRQSRQSWK